MEWNEEDAVRVLQESLALVGAITQKVRGELTGGGDGGVIQELKELITGLHPEELGSPRKPWITREDARKIMSLLEKQSVSDGATLLRMSSDLMSQTDALMKMLVRVRGDFKPAVIGEDWEDFLSTEQMLQVMTWVEEAKHAKPIE